MAPLDYMISKEDKCRKIWKIKYVLKWSVGEWCLNVVYIPYMIYHLYVGSFGDICTIQSRRYGLQLGQPANGHARFQSEHMEGAKSQFFLTQDRPNTEH